MSASDEPFLNRWSRRKADDRGGKPVPASPTKDVETDTQTATTANDATSPKTLTEDDFKDVNFDALDYTSDYSRFMQKGVPESIRQKALQKLWTSDPLFTAVDPFQDYAGDFTDAALAVPGDLLKSAYKVGQGFLTDEEAKVWDDLGKPVEEQTPEQTAPDDVNSSPASALSALPLRRLMPGYAVRRATPADAADLSRVATLALSGAFEKAHGRAFAQGLMQQAAEDALTTAIDEGLHLNVAIASDADKIIGFCGGRERDITWHVVWPEYGRKGVGLALLLFTEQALGQRDVPPNVLASRLSAPMLQRLGYEAIAEQMVTVPGGQSQMLPVMRRAPKHALP